MDSEESESDSPDFDFLESESNLSDFEFLEFESDSPDLNFLLLKLPDFEFIDLKG